MTHRVFHFFIVIGCKYTIEGEAMINFILLNLKNFIEDKSLNFPEIYFWFTYVLLKHLKYLIFPTNQIQRFNIKNIMENVTF